MKTLKVRDLSATHPVVKAGHSMAKHHALNSTMLPALEAVNKEHPDVDSDTLIVLWIGVNCKYIELKEKDNECDG